MGCYQMPAVGRVRRGSTPGARKQARCPMQWQKPNHWANTVPACVLRKLESWTTPIKPSLLTHNVGIPITFLNYPSAQSTPDSSFHIKKKVFSVLCAVFFPSLPKSLPLFLISKKKRRKSPFSRSFSCQVQDKIDWNPFNVCVLVSEPGCSVQYVPKSEC